MVNEYLNGVIEFRFFRPNARRVYLVGDFNGWHRSSLAMRRTDDGWWTYRLRLDPGVYQFQYLADGRRYLDWAAFGVERGPLGGWNSVVVVGEQTKSKPPWWRAASPQVAAAVASEA